MVGKDTRRIETPGTKEITAKIYISLFKNNKPFAIEELDGVMLRLHDAIEMLGHGDHLRLHLVDDLKIFVYTYDRGMSNELAFDLVQQAATQIGFTCSRV